MALVFTAIANAQCTLLLRAEYLAQVRGGTYADYFQARHSIAIVLISIGLYGFGMSLNDIIDRRRDRQIAAHRPLPSGRLGLYAANVVCGTLLAIALAAGLYYATSPPGGGWLSLLLLVGTALLIVFYDYAGKYLVAPGLLTLGMIRFFHALVPAPQFPLLWHPLLLFNHVTILSAIAYRWEEKRPALTRLHWWVVIGGLVVVNGTAVAAFAVKAADRPASPGFWVTPWLLLPLATAVAYVALTLVVRRRASTSRAAGQAAMLYGLLWLIIYDAAFAAAYVGLLPAILLLLLLPVAYLAVVLMRWWSQLLLLSHRPEYKRVEVQ